MRPSAVIIVELAFFFSSLTGLFPGGARAGDVDPDSDKYNVCFITINSTEEREIFQKRLGDQHFKFTELTTLNGQSTNPKGWFDRACKSGVSCDVLVISGHSAGGFLQKDGYGLPLEEMLRHSCREDCKGILRQPLEVFQFGCNTMSSNAWDTRGPDAYLNVLLEHHFKGARALGVVDLRYGSGTILQAMQSVYQGVSHLYGFHSVGPSGKNVQSLLEQYFSEMPDYHSYLQVEEQKRLSATLQDLQPEQHDNHVLSSALSVTHFAQCNATFAGTSEEAAYRRVICKFADSKATALQKLTLVKQLIESDSRRKYQFFINQFLKKSHPEKSTDPKIKKILHEIRSLEAQKADFLDDFSRQPSLTIKAEWADFARHLGWIDDVTFAKAKADFVRRLLGSTPELNARDSQAYREFICEQSQSPVPLSLTMEDLPKAYFKSAEGLKQIQCIKPSDPKILDRLLRMASTSESPLAESALTVLASYAPFNAEFTGRISKHREELEKTLAREPSSEPRPQLIEFKKMLEGFPTE